MVKAMRNSDLHIAVAGSETILDSNARKKISSAFSDVFEGSAKKVSDVIEANFVELVYEVKAPVVNDSELIQEFFESLEIVLDELAEFNPHFTQLKHGDKNA